MAVGCSWWGCSASKLVAMAVQRFNPVIAQRAIRDGTMSWPPFPFPPAPLSSSFLLTVDAGLLDVSLVQAVTEMGGDVLGPIKKDQRELKGRDLPV